jgi:hypothetical protein
MSIYGAFIKCPALANLLRTIQFAKRLHHPQLILLLRPPAAPDHQKR